MGFQDKLLDVAALAIPPLPGASEEDVRKWRWSVVLVVMFLFASFVGHFAWAAGLPVPWLWKEDAGFVSKQDFTAFTEIAATKSEIQQLQTAMSEFGDQITEQSRRQTKARLNDLQQDMFTMARQRCEAVGEYKSMLTEQINALQDEYTDLKGRAYTVPACENLR